MEPGAVQSQMTRQNDLLFVVKWLFRGVGGALEWCGSV